MSMGIFCKIKQLSARRVNRELLGKALTPGGRGGLASAREPHKLFGIGRVYLMILCGFFLAYLRRQNQCSHNEDRYH